MTRKDFILIAEVLSEVQAFSNVDRDTMEFVAERMADRLATTNSSFKRERFLAACGVK